MTTEEQVQNQQEGVGCWMMTLIAIVIIFGLIVAFLVLTGG